MYDAALVQVRDAEDKLAKDPPRLGCREATFLDEVVEQLPTRAEFGDEVDRGLSRDNFVQGEDVRVSEPTVVVDFPREERERRGRVGSLISAA